MTWTAWRQQRSLVITMTTVAVVAAILLIFMGKHESEVWRSFLANPCKGNADVSAANQNVCGVRLQKVVSAGRFNKIAMIFGVLLGPFFGSILGVNAVARELEVGTTRLAWTQSLSRPRWLASKFSVNVTILLVIFVPLCLIYDWWNAAAHYGARISPLAFPIAGFLPLAYSLVAFSLAVLLGLFLRRAGWSLATGLLLTAVVVLVVEIGIRPILVSPQFVVVSSSEISLGSSIGFYSEGGVPLNSWGRGNGYAPKGTKSTPSAQTLIVYSNKMNQCMSTPRGHTPSGSEYCVTHLHVENVGLYVPGSDFWNLQFSEFAIYFGFALLLTAGSVIKVRRMLT
jgi:ABC-type transport system involved in multi-copper enzyme maturation permease subunit